MGKELFMPLCIDDMQGILLSIIGIMRIPAISGARAANACCFLMTKDSNNSSKESM